MGQVWRDTSALHEVIDAQIVHALADEIGFVDIAVRARAEGAPKADASTR